MSSAPLLEVQGLSVYFPIRSGFLRKVTAHVRAVDDMDFSLHHGEILGIVGESGSGKSTLARATVRLIEPTAGDIRFLGEDVRAFDEQTLRRWRVNAQMVFQDPFASLNPRKTIFETLSEPLWYHGRIQSKEEEIERVTEILEQIMLPRSALQRYPHQFSGGQQQRICIGRALALDPQLLICDEAVSALDVSVQAQILNLLLTLQKSRKLSYLFISHDLSIIRHMCDQVMVMYLGKMMESGPALEVLEHPKHPYTQALIAAEPKKHPSETLCRVPLKGEIPSSIHPPSGCPFRTRCPYAQPECAENPPKKVIGNNHVYNCILP